MDDGSIPVKSCKLLKESWFKRYIKTIDTSLFVVIVIALVFSLFYKLLFLRWEASSETVYHLGDWSFILSMSILAAAIFHFFTVHYPLIRDRERYVDIVNLSVMSLITKSDSFIKDNLQFHYIGFDFAGNVPTEKEWENRKKLSVSNQDIDWREVCCFIIDNTRKEFEILSNYKNEYKDIFLIVCNLYGSELMRSEDVIKDKKEDVQFFKLEPLLFNYLQEIAPLYEYYNDIISKMLNSHKVKT